jgi:hypothetical protein
MIDKLKALVLEGGYDEESRQYVHDLQNRLHRAVMSEKLMENPIIIEYLDYLKIEIERCSYLLGNDQTLTEPQRTKLFAKRELSEEFLKLFSHDREVVEDEVSQLLKNNA